MIQALPKTFGAAPSDPNSDGRDAARRDNVGATLRNLYNTARWRHPEKGVRAFVLVRDGFQCAICEALLIGAHPAPNSPVVDHITPHRGNLVLFWDPANLQALCKFCHDGEKQRRDNMAQAGGVS